MTDALDSLFNSPPGPSRPPPPLSTRSPSRSPSPSPARRRGSEPLFLSPGATPTRPNRAALNFEPEVDPFEEFESRYRADANTTTEDRGIPTSGLGVYDPLAMPGDAGDNDEDADGPAKKKRKPIPKIDAERLMGPYGLPALMREANRFKVKGKGHETADLKALLEVYQMWSHRMFPKGDFMGTMGRVENVLRTRRMENAMKGYRDAFHPPPAPTSPLPDDRLLTPPPVDEEREGHAPVNTRDEPLFDDVDLDEMAAMEEMEREAGRPRAVSTSGSEPPMLQEEDEWEGLYD